MTTDSPPLDHIEQLLTTTTGINHTQAPFRKRVTLPSLFSFLSLLQDHQR